MRKYFAETILLQNKWSVSNPLTRTFDVYIYNNKKIIYTDHF